MNPNNYCTREAAQLLEKAGIALKTDMMWVTDGIDFQLMNSMTKFRAGMKISSFPAPCFTEVWRELPDKIDGEFIMVYQSYGKTYCEYNVAVLSYNTNPTDALIDLLIWVEEQKKVRR